MIPALTVKIQACIIKFLRLQGQYDHIASTIKQNYDCKALASVVNNNRKRDTTIWSIP